MKRCCLLYLTRHSPGVLQKAEAQAAAARALGIDFDFVIISGRPLQSSHNVRHVAAPFLRYPFIVKYFVHLFCGFRTMRRAIDWGTYDKVVLRYPLTIGVGALPFFSEYGQKLITEHHSDAPAEMRKKSMLGRISAWVEERRSPQALRCVAGIIGVTDEITRRMLKHSSATPHFTFSNGIDAARFAFTGFRPYRAGPLTVLFVANTFSPWHGVDRLIRSLKAYEGTTEVILNLVGNPDTDTLSIAEDCTNPRVRINFLGRCFGDTLDGCFRDANIAVSTLALHRNTMTQACPLKSREYMARGIPFVYAYTDPDLPAECQFALKCANDDTLVDINRIVEFAAECARIPDLSRQMRKFAEARLSWEAKMEQLNNFIDSLPP